MSERRKVDMRKYSRSGGDAYACRRCGCRDWRPASAVEYTYGPKGQVLIKRRRNVVCGRCGNKAVIETEETATSILETPDEDEDSEAQLSIFPTNAKSA